jgi:hypothetical protein
VVFSEQVFQQFGTLVLDALYSFFELSDVVPDPAGCRAVLVHPGHQLHHLVELSHAGNGEVFVVLGDAGPAGGGEAVDQQGDVGEEGREIGVVEVINALVEGLE